MDKRMQELVKKDVKECSNTELIERVGYLKGLKDAIESFERLMKRL